LISQLIETVGALPAARGDVPPEFGYVIDPARKPRSGHIQRAGKVALEIRRQNGIGYGPTNDGEPLRPAATRNRPAEFASELLKDRPDLCSEVLSLTPTWRLSLKGLPVLIARILVRNLRCVNDPRQPMPPSLGGRMLRRGHQHV
jgi:hypothetical protein